MKIVLSPSAVRDLQSISDYTLRNWGTEQEQRYLKELWEKLAAVQSNSSSFQLREDLVKSCRSARHGQHVIFFAVQEQTLQIIRILHGAMDFSSHLPTEDLLD
jgi:toxin ParE1/3/4